jgi:hypothetical protein
MNKIAAESLLTIKKNIKTIIHQLDFMCIRSYYFFMVGKSFLENN